VAPQTLTDGVAQSYLPAKSVSGSHVTATTTARRDRVPEEDAGRITVVVVAGIRVYRDGLCQLLRAHPCIANAAPGRNVDEALILLHAIHPNVLVVDVASNAGLLAARRLGEAAAHVPVVGTGISDSEREVVAAAEAGLAGFVSADADVDELIAAARSATRGELLCSPRVADILRRRITTLARDLTHEETARLTAREREVMALIEAGLSNREVAGRLSIEISTVKNHVRNVFEKLDVRDREAAVSRLRLDDAVCRT
jgi:two-component system, NarL family, nitrate/nitrite response regulator NarL